MRQNTAIPTAGDLLSDSGTGFPGTLLPRLLSAGAGDIDIHPEWHGYSVRHDGWSCRERRMPHHVVFACSEGSATGRVNGEPFHLEPGGLLYIGPDLPMDMAWSVPFGFAEVYFRCDADAGASVWRHRSAGADVATPYLQRLSELILTSNVDATTDMRRRLLIALVVLEAFRPQPSKGVGHRLNAQPRDRTTRFIRQNLHRRIKLDDVAHTVGLSSDYFSRLFRRTYGQTFRAYIIRHRVDRARRMLLESDLPVARIAAHLGYANVAQFSKQYRQYAGTTPSATRDASGV
ncbi:MAG: AraC family transcriptional regulator [Planctomycetota bacterium]